MSKTIHYGRRTPQPAFLINKGKDFHDDMGMLKEETSTNYGETGVGTSTGAEPTSKKATYSFLDNEKFDIKKSYNFKPKTDISYGAN